MSFEFVIESCKDCKSHQWNTRHDEAQYNQYSTEVAAKLQELIPGCVVNINKVPKVWAEHSQYCQLIPNEDDNNPNYDILPRLGAFEVSTVHKGHSILFFSKLMTRMWPDPATMTNRINQFKQDSQQEEAAVLQEKY